MRDYLYIPLGGNRAGPARRYLNLMITMLLGGLWHGAAWTFVIWGGLHGLFLVVNHGWNGLSRRLNLPSVPPALGWALTFLGVVVGWVFFRAPSLDAATNILSAMFLGAPQNRDAGLVDWTSLAGLAVLGAIVLLCPNTQQLFDRAFYLGHVERHRGWTWAPKPVWAAAIACCAAIATFAISRQSVFLYFQF